MENIVYLYAAELRESPFNPRKHYPETDLQELATSIRQQGVMQPIVVRPLPDGQADIEQTHEVVFGHRRLRASVLAELEEVPCIVRTMTDREAAVCQAHENAKRTDVTPFEEADSFAHLMDKHGMSADQVAEAVGKSRSYVYGRLKLHAASPAVRAAYADQGLSAEIALELARIPLAKMQEAALKAVKAHYGDGWLSTRDAKTTLKHRYVFDLKEAPFPLGDATLVPSAGACHQCQKLSHNDPDLSTEPGTFCLDKGCHDGKVAAFRDRELEEAARAGHTVLEGDEAKALMSNTWSHVPGYVRTDHVDVNEGESELDWADLCARAKEQGIQPPKQTLVVLDPTKAPIALLRKSDVDDLATALKLKPRAEVGSRQERHDPHAGWTAAERAMSGGSTDITRAILAAAAGRRRSTEELRLVLEYLLDYGDDFGMAGEVLGIQGGSEVGGDGPDLRQAWIRSASPDQLAALLVLQVLEERCSVIYGSREKAASAVALASHYGVDVAALAARKTEPTPPSAARAADGDAPAAPAAPAGAKVKKAKAKTDVQKVDAGGSAAVEHAEAVA